MVYVRRKTLEPWNELVGTYLSTVRNGNYMILHFDCENIGIIGLHMSPVEYEFIKDDLIEGELIGLLRTDIENRLYSVRVCRE